MEEVLAILAIALCIFLFAGEPDIHDKILNNYFDGCESMSFDTKEE